MHTLLKQPAAKHRCNVCGGTSNTWNYGILPKSHTGDLWGSAPDPARFFEKSVGKTVF